jgi:hypothetical protein
MANLREAGDGDNVMETTNHENLSGLDKRI